MGRNYKWECDYNCNCRCLVPGWPSWDCDDDGDCDVFPGSTSYWPGYCGDDNCSDDDGDKLDCCIGKPPALAETACQSIEDNDVHGRDWECRYDCTSCWPKNQRGTYECS